MSTVPMHRLVLPSALMLTSATDVVGAIDALKPMATPRPRRTTPVPRSNGADQFRRAASVSSTRSIAASCIGGAGRLRAAFAQDVLAPELDRIDPESAGDHVGVALVGPHQLRNAEAAQRAGRRPVGVELERADAHVLDVVGSGRREAGLLGDARPDVRVGAAVPPDVAFARDDAAVLAHAALDAERGRVLGDDVELLLHGERDLDRPAHDERQRRHQRLELDVDLGAEAAAQIRHLHAHARLRPAEQARDLDAHERRHLRRRYG